MNSDDISVLTILMKKSDYDNLSGYTVLSRHQGWKITICGLGFLLQTLRVIIY